MSIQTIPAIEPQPDFPECDLSDDNARMLGLMLANPGELKFNHNAAEQYSWVYRVGHPAIIRALDHTITNDSILDAINHGVVTYEAICTLVQHLPVPDVRGAMLVTHNASLLANHTSPDDVVEYVGKARQKFERRMPRTAGVVYEASERFLGVMADYAIHGAALARQFDHNAVA
jgi:hypothetical protein